MVSKSIQAYIIGPEAAILPEVRQVAQSLGEKNIKPIHSLAQQIIRHTNLILNLADNKNFATQTLETSVDKAPDFCINACGHLI